jgi:hypothetical protein
MPGMADLSRKIHDTIKDEERHSLFKEIDQQILLLFAMVFNRQIHFMGNVII